MTMPDMRAFLPTLSEISRAAKTLEVRLSSLSKTSGRISMETQSALVSITKALQSSPRASANHLKDAQKSKDTISQLFSKLEEDFSALQSEWSKHQEAVKSFQSPRS